MIRMSTMALLMACAFSFLECRSAVEDTPVSSAPLTLDTEQSTGVFTGDSKVTDVMNDPAFQGHGNLLFPVNRNYWSGERLKDLRLTWYSHIHAAKTVEVVNYLKAQAQAGEPFFIDIYTEAEKESRPCQTQHRTVFLQG